MKPRMSALFFKRGPVCPPKADIKCDIGNVCFWPIADMALLPFTSALALFVMAEFVNDVLDPRRRSFDGAFTIQE
jgi:hypothetical protein